MHELLDRLADHLRARADEAPAVALLQPAEPFLDTVGEAMRRRLFVTENENGASLCLRPEFTIPLCLHHIASDSFVGTSYAGVGTVFRQGREAGEASEFPQADIEYLGHSAAARTDVLALDAMLDALAVAGIADVTVTLGDKALFGALVASLGLSPSWQNRLARAFGDPLTLQALTDELASPPAGPPGSDEERWAVEGDTERLEAHVRDLMRAGGLSPRAGRDPAVIATRAVERARDARQRLDPFTLHVLRTFLALDQPLADALASLETLGEQGEIAWNGTLAALHERAASFDAGAVRFRAGFGRPLDYYTGLLFEARLNGIAVAGGGRYDRLCSVLGAASPVPAVGFTIAVDRLPGWRP